MSSYELWLTTDSGLRIAQVTTFNQLTASRVVDGIGWLDLVLPATFDTSLVTVPDRQLQVWRQPAGGALYLWRAYFIRRWAWQTQGASETLTVAGPDCNDLLRRRIVAHYTGTPQSDKYDFADDMMKEYVTEAIADGVNPTPTAGTRVWADLSVAADVSAGPVVQEQANWGSLLTSSNAGVLADIAQASREAGTEVFFDVVPDTVSASAITFQFRTYIGQPGQDVSDRVVFDRNRGNLSDVLLEYDFSEEANYVYAGGPGDGYARIVRQVYDAGRYSASQWNRCEAFASTNATAPDGVEDAGRAALANGRPKRRFNGTPLDTKGTRFGVDWDHGYQVRARYRDAEFDAIVRSTVIQVDEHGSESVQARLEYEGD
jgi:hypothetical protein